MLRADVTVLLTIECCALYDACVVLGDSKMTIKYKPRCFLDVEIDSKPGEHRTLLWFLLLII